MAHSYACFLSALNQTEHMRLHWGAIPPSPDFIPDEIWKPLKEPSCGLAQVISVPIGVAAAAVVALLWFAFTPLHEIKALFSLPRFLGLSVCILIVHELVHTAAHPFVGLSPRSIVGIWPSRLIGFAHYDGELSRNRFVTILLMPLVTITVLPLLLAAVIHTVSVWVAFASVLNALASAVDVLGAAMVLCQIPPNAILRNQGWRTYWKLAFPNRAITDTRSR